MAIKSWDLDIGSPEGHLKLEDSPSRLKEIKDHCATSGSFYAEAQTTPDRTIAIYEGVVYFGITKVEYAGLDIVDLGPAGAFEVSALTVNYFNKILFTINSSGTLEATEGTEAATAGTVVAPSILVGKFPICMVTIQDDGTGTAGTILTIEQGEIVQLQAFARIHGGTDNAITSMTGLDDDGIPLAKVANAASDGTNSDITSMTGLDNDGIPGAKVDIPEDPVAVTPGLRTLGTTALKACAGNDSRLSDTRTPLNASVSQAKLKTSIGSVSQLGTQANLTLPGGSYGFYPQHKSNHVDYEVLSSMGGVDSTAASLSYITSIFLGSTGATGYAQQRYVTASGEVHWVFILRDKATKQICSMYQAPDHPCFGNGGKPLLTPHPFGNYDESKHEIIAINPTNEEIEQMELETIVDDETLSDKDLLDIITENYEIDENSSPAWPTKEVTVGLPKHIKDHKGKRALVDYRFMKEGTIIKPIKKVIPKPDYIKVKKLKRK